MLLSVKIQTFLRNSQCQNRFRKLKLLVSMGWKSGQQAAGHCGPKISRIPKYFLINLRQPEYTIPGNACLSFALPEIKKGRESKARYLRNYTTLKWTFAAVAWSKQLGVLQRTNQNECLRNEMKRKHASWGWFEIDLDRNWTTAVASISVTTDDSFGNNGPAFW